jgi:type IV fimbrial biogenesis protein FimT
MPHVKYYGFSLFELLIAMTIIIILLVIAIPNESLFIQKSQDEVMSQQLLRAIYLARSEAISRSETVTLCESADLKTCSGEWLQGYIIATDNTLISTYQNATHMGAIHWRTFPKGRKVLTFLASGLSEIENGTFWYCPTAESKAHWAIVISQSGRARLELPNAAGTIVDSDGNELEC